MKPHCCPVCLGCGTQNPNGYYGVGTWPACHPCSGTGIVWEMEPMAFNSPHVSFERTSEDGSLTTWAVPEGSGAPPK